MKRIVLLLMLASPLLGRAQAELRIDYILGVSVPSLNPSISEVNAYGTLVRNYSTIFSFNDSLRIYIGVLDSLGQPQVMDEVNKGWYSLDPSGSGTDSVLLDTVTIDVNPAFFQEGNNTVVIWPAAPGTYTLDTFYFDIVYNSVNELIDDGLNVRLGPNPASDRLYLGDPENVVKQVRIRSVDGKLLAAGATNSLIYLGGFNNGVYLIELETAHQVYIRKLIIRK